MENINISEADIGLRRLKTLEEYRACVRLQHETWGEDFEDRVPVSILKVAQRIGGVTAGAFDRADRLMGFVFGITGIEDGRIVHWSDMLAVRDEARGLGLGQKLKWFQRDLLLPIGAETVYWTYDPLEARNAHLNINRLGAQPVEYIENMYGDTGSELHEGIGTDRFVVAWPLRDERVEQARKGTLPTNYDAFEDAPVVNTQEDESGRPDPYDGDLVGLSALRVEIPPNIQSLKAEQKGLGPRWRAATRRAFTYYLHSGYEVSGFVQDPRGRCFYCLTNRG